MSNKPSKQLIQRAVVIMVVTCIIGFGAGFFGLINAQLINGEK